ncbi:L,D-transpeptidase family protein [Carnobacterium sp.]|uniref:L,D-transpeptidase family protein n=1 Tax=Carnobacterium sp. TaxID=48221 RepID=UPI0028B0CAC7|nr:L,D-transpeptidase family protein [Carnobacterium sp.]
MHSKGKKIIISVVLALFLFGSGIALYQHNIKVQAEEAHEELQRSLHVAEKNMNALYLDEKKEWLSDSISDKKIKEAELSIEAVTASNLSKEEQLTLDTITEQVQDAKSMFGIQSSINKKFNNEMITKDTIEFSDEEKELSLLKKNKPAFVKKMNEIIEQSKQQIEIKQALVKLFSDYDQFEVKPEVSRSDYESLKNKADSLSSETFKTSLTEHFDAIQTALKEREAKEKEERIQKEKEEQEQLEQEKQKKELESKAAKEEEHQQSANADVSASSSVSDVDNEDSGNSQDAANSSSDSAAASSQTVPAQQTGIEGLIASSQTSQSTDQILGVVANGSSSTVYLFEKNGSQWETVLSIPGRVGYNGVGSSYEGSGRTPKGAYQLGFAFGTGPNPGTNLAYKQITGNSYWISNPDDSQYNTWQERSSSSSLDEHMSDYPTQYKYGITLNYNNGVNGGSAFFVHVNGNGATAGCISVSESTML